VEEACASGHIVNRVFIAVPNNDYGTTEYVVRHRPGIHLIRVVGQRLEQ
jgi:hypothetical protein